MIYRWTVELTVGPDQIEAERRSGDTWLSLCERDLEEMDAPASKHGGNITITTEVVFAIDDPQEDDQP